MSESETSVSEDPAATSVAAEPEFSAAKYERLIELLVSTRRWVRSVTLFTLLGSAAFALMTASNANNLFRAGPNEPLDGMIRGTIIDGATSLVLWFAGWYLWQYSSRLAQFADTRQAVSLEAAIDAQRKHWRLVGTLSAIGVGLAVLWLALALPGWFG